MDPPTEHSRLGDGRGERAIAIEMGDALDGNFETILCGPQHVYDYLKRPPANLEA